jgi:hypothetical protein
VKGDTAGATLVPTVRKAQSTAANKVVKWVRVVVVIFNSFVFVHIPA